MALGPGGLLRPVEPGDAHRASLGESVYVGADADAQVHATIMPDGRAPGVRGVSGS
jgi:hypothetical protein